MPKENKHGRGRREEKKLKRKRDQGEEYHLDAKRQRLKEPLGNVEFIGLDGAEPDEGGAGATERPFYGLLEDEEQEYFRHADELLELNDFPTPEDRSLFLANIYREAEGKELKIACSQSCSRLMERLILLSNVEQKKKLFENFSGNFPHLVQHRFASHCCETLFIQSAPIVTQELVADSRPEGPLGIKEGEVYVSMENLFIFALNELEGQMTFLLTDRFASHTLRVLLVILSGRSLEKSSTRSMLQSKRKEKISITGIDSNSGELSLNKRAVPESFQFAVERIISDTVATMDASFIKVLATHPTGNPSLQLLLELELTNPNTKKGANSSQKTIVSALLPDDITSEGSESATFVNGILYDPIGSRLLETITTFAPGKLFKQIYRTTFKDRIAALARNEIASYVVIRVLTRLSKEDLEEAVTSINSQIESLVSRSRTLIIKTLLERCDARGVDTSDLTTMIAQAYGSDPSTLILKMAAIDDISYITIHETSKDEGPPKPAPKPTAPQLHGSLLAQAMLLIPGPPTTLIQDSFLTLPQATLLTLASYATTSHIIQASLAPTPTNVTFRRKLINTLIPPSSPNPPESDNYSQDSILQLALSPIGSHTLDALLVSTTTSNALFSLTERIATSLLTHEALLRDSFTGRIVWRNWMMDLFTRRKGDWVKKMKEAGANGGAGNSTSHSASRSGSVGGLAPGWPASGAGREQGEIRTVGKKMGEKEDSGKGKSAIELAREKFAKAKVSKDRMKNSKGTGANKIAT